MAYTPREIKDRVAVGDDIFIVEDLGNNRIRLIPDPIHVSEPGTPINKALLQPIEDFLATLDTNRLIPSGVIVMWSGAVDAIPEGWALCDGSNGTPDLRDRFIVGAGGSYSVGDTGGSNSVTLSVSEMPSHQHGTGTLRTDFIPGHTHSLGKPSNALVARASFGRVVAAGDDYQLPNFELDLVSDTGGAGDHRHDISGETSAAGGGQAHENRPPYYALAYIMKL
jgi:microcystin-dependent protein